MVDKLKLCISYCQYAAERLKAAGFEHVYTSMRSEACYYTHPTKPGCNLRVAMHKFGRTEGACVPRNNGVTVANILFPIRNCSPIPSTWEKVDVVIFLAVGRFFMFSEGIINKKGYGT